MLYHQYLIHCVKNKAKSIATVVTNEQTLKVMQNYSYDDLFTVEKDNDNKISLIKSNINNINKIVAQIALNVQKELDNKGREDISIALGSFTGLKLLFRKRPWCANKNIIYRKYRNKFKKPI